jgi:ribose transport system substrate-binding protein
MHTQVNQEESGMDRQQVSRGWRARTGMLMAVALVGSAVAVGCGSEKPKDSASGDTAGSAGGGGGEPAASNGAICVSSLVGFAIVPDLLRIWEDTAKKNNMEFSSAIASPEGDLNSAQSNVNSCVRKKSKITVNITTPDATLQAPIKQTTAAGNFFVGQYSGAPVEGQTLSLSPDDPAMSKQLFDWAKENLADKGTKPVVLPLTTSAFPVVVNRIGSFSKLATDAGWKVLKPQEMRPDKVAADATSKTAAALRNNPDVNIILAYTDDVTAGAAPAVRDAGKEDQVKVLAWEGLEPTYAEIRAGKSLVAAIAGAPIQIMNDLQVWAVRGMLDGSFAKGSSWRCVGPLITPDNVPPKGEPNKGGSCQEGTELDDLGAVVNGKTYTAEQLASMAAEK